MEDPKSYFDTLPDELIVRILSLLDLKHLKKIKYQNRRFQSICADNSKYLRKKSVSFTISAVQDDNDNPVLDIETSDPKEFNLRCSSTEISPKVPFYLDWGSDKILEQKHYKMRYEKYTGFLFSVSSTIGDGRDFSLEPLPVSSLESGFQAALDYFLRRCSPERLELTEDERHLTSEEMGWILKVIKANRTTVDSISRRTETIHDFYLDLINRTKSESVIFCGTFDGERVPDHSNVSVENRISKLTCPSFYFYEKDIISIESVLNLLKEWRDGTRKIRAITYWLSEFKLDWFPLVKTDFKTISEPEALMWTMNADVHLHHCAIGRYIDDEILDLHYFDESIEIKCRTPAVVQPSTPEPARKQSTDVFDEEDDLGFGLFD